MNIKLNFNHVDVSSELHKQSPHADRLWSVGSACPKGCFLLCLSNFLGKQRFLEQRPEEKQLACVR